MVLRHPRRVPALPPALSPLLIHLLLLHRISRALASAEPSASPPQATEDAASPIFIKALPSLLRLAKPLANSVVETATTPTSASSAAAAVPSTAAPSRTLQAGSIHASFGLPRRAAFGARVAASATPAEPASAESASAATAGSSSIKPQWRKGPIQYLGGPVVTGSTLDVYLIYYGSWPAGSGQRVFENFVRSLSKSTRQGGGGGGVASVKSWWEISAGYYMAADGSSRYVSSEVRLAGVAYDAYSQGSTGLSESFVSASVRHLLSTGKLPFDSEAVYMMIGSKDVQVNGFCTDYCGWHSQGSYGGARLIFGFQGHHGACPNGCMTQSTSPNGIPGVDATVSTLAHEIAEAATDPDLRTGWLAPSGDENADLCSWQYGNSNPLSGRAVVKFATGANGFQYKYNLVGAGGMRFLVQMNWDRTKQKCVIRKGGAGGGGGMCSALPGGLKEQLCRTIRTCC
ncbi:hypothetical protein CLOP_g23828 [Closterium sp. NIES-67]|nr:hypothetical protein CLOP_g23828 [Closterium sp. NIES-67]